MKVCDRAYVTEDEEEESMSEHSYSPGIYIETHSHILPPAVCVFFSSRLVFMENKCTML